MHNPRQTAGRIVGVLDGGIEDIALGSGEALRVDHSAEGVDRRGA